MASDENSKSPLPVYKCEAYLIPVERLKKSHIEKAHAKFTYRFYDDKKCARCDNLEYRHNDLCDACVGFKAIKQVSKIVEKGSRSFLSLPRGATEKVRNWLTAIGYKGNYVVKPRYQDAEPFKRKIRMTREPWAYQREAADTLKANNRGILDSPPRSGKTVMIVCVVVEVGKKTLILGSQREWLLQFQETFLGSAEQKAFTNAQPHQVKLCRTLRDFQETDICLSTFSRFMSPGGKKLLSQIKDLFGVIAIDEVHFTPALETSRVVAQLNAERLYGVSGTVERKVTDEINIAHDLIGPVIHRCEVKRLRPRVQLLETGIKIKDPAGGQAGFTYFQSRLESDPGRRNIIIKRAIAMAKAGHLVLIPMTRVNSILTWTREINYETEQPGFALPFFGGLQKDRRAAVIRKARNYETRIVVGNIALLSTGLNIPRASCIINVTATANIPKCEQRLSRVLTPWEDKPDPVVVLVLDDSDMIRKCMRYEWYNCIKPRFNPIISKDDEYRLSRFFSNRPDRLSFKLSEGV